MAEWVKWKHGEGPPTGERALVAVTWAVPKGLPTQIMIAARDARDDWRDDEGEAMPLTHWMPLPGLPRGL